MNRRVAIVGTGITGLSVAYHFPKNTQITFFDKSRRPGGRVCTRTSRQHPDYIFDHGAPFIRPQGQFLNLLKKINAIEQVKLRVCSSFVQKQQVKEKIWINGTPKIQSIPLKLLSQLKTFHKIQQEYNTRIAQIYQKQKQQNKEQYCLKDQNNKQFGPYDSVFFCIPYPQCRMIKQKYIQLIYDKQQKDQYICNWVIMLAANNNDQLAKRLDGLDVGMNVTQNINSFVNQKCKGHTAKNQQLWVFQMKDQWSMRNKDFKPEEVQSFFVKQLTHSLDIKNMKTNFIKAHRWLYGTPRKTPQTFFNTNNIFFGSDWAGCQPDVNSNWNLGKKISLVYQNMGTKSAL